MPLEQATRMLNLTTPLGENELLLTAFHGKEEMSRLFEYQLDMISDNADVKPTDIVGQNISFSVERPDNSRRFFNGFVSRFAAGDEDEQGRRNYRAVVVPWLWFLTRTTDCRIFQEMSVVQIIEQIFGDLGFSDFDISARNTHPTREYCVQYRESDFNFVSRLAEEEGIFYFFEHSDGKHMLKMSDDPSGYIDCEETEVDYPRDFGSRAIEDHILSWEHRYEFRTGKVAHTDYNFKTPSTSLMSNEQTLMKIPGVDAYEYYDYPGEYGVKGDGDGLARVRMEEEEAGHDVVEATSLCKTFTPGGKFKIKQHRSKSEEGKGYVIVAIEHFASEPQSYEVGGAGDEDYRNRFTCIPDSAKFRPERITPKPLIRGVQTAVVVGPGGEEIYTDDFARVKVQFHWDREGKKDENSSCWIRVSQNWAGQNWGIVFNPRIGQEVVISFLEGDPDQPLITGRVYNAEQMPPYELPSNKTQSGVKSRSTKGGGADNFNEIRFEDLKGEEEMYIHAEKDRTIVVENDEAHSVGHDRKKSIEHDETTTVGNDRTESVGNDETVDIGRNRGHEVGQDDTLKVGESRNQKVGKNESLDVGQSQTVKIGKDASLSVKGSQSIVVEKDQSADVSGARTTNVGKNDTLEVGKKLTIVAGDEIVIKTGKASITMKKNGDILIDGKNIKVKGSGKINNEASSDVTIKGSKVKLN